MFRLSTCLFITDMVTKQSPVCQLETALVRRRHNLTSHILHVCILPKQRILGGLLAALFAPICRGNCRQSLGPWRGNIWTLILMVIVFLQIFRTVICHGSKIDLTKKSIKKKEAICSLDRRFSSFFWFLSLVVKLHEGFAFYHTYLLFICCLVVYLYVYVGFKFKYI